MLDFRYHIFYLGLMFLMLGFGVFIGASLTGPALVRQQTGAIKTLRGEANQVVQERDQTRDRVQKDEEGLSALRPALVQGILKGKHVIVIQTGDYSDATEAASSALSDAGATVTATVVLPDKWESLSPGQRTTLAQAAGGGDDPAALRAAMMQSLAATLVHGTASGRGAVVLPALQTQSLMTISGDIAAPCAFFVLVGGHADDGSGVDGSGLDGSGLDAALLNGFAAQSPKVTLAGCEPFTAAVSSVPAFQAAGVSTVDCVDLPLGQIALPLVLQGNKGDFGLKATADRTLPALPETGRATP